MERIVRKRQQHLSARHYIGRSTTDTALSHFVRLVADHFGFPMVLVNLLDSESQHTIAAVGMDTGIRPRSQTLCHQVVRDGRPTALQDMDVIPASAAHVRSYIGVPIIGREGIAIGSLCLLDTVPREFGNGQLEKLQSAAAVVRDQLELMRRVGSGPAGSTAEAEILAAAIDSGQIVPFYQPVVDLASGKVRSVEALARWHHPARGLIQPGGFVPLAEDSDIVIDLDLSILRQAATDLRHWQSRTPDLRLNVNLSARHLDNPDALVALTDTVLDAGISPDSIDFEVTETAALAFHPGGGHLLEDLRACGFRIVLDDFGTGFSSMEQVMNLPIDGIKLDRSVTAALGTLVGDAVLRALLGLADDLGFDSVIEGVETSEQAARARKSGCLLGQGFLFAPPLAANDFRQLLRMAG
ncbi:EAL domain-containing protein [Nakamurella sp. PAMC28650]|uniref:sensor domain-containing phosphodiesterase n=1 Tax=Nakamurella sp. PAMC28650 TaxID=2762325 RepID=UPI00164DAC4A|nr:EAL domain-containing protein [Nakamurella sp. PAMC28650]QNK80732.1 EAL domain-containing protein [Nakamurella sp. PAMC28650]